MLTVQNYNLTPSKVHFKAKEKQTTNNNITGSSYTEPFKTHAGLKTGAVYGALLGISGILTGGLLYAGVGVLTALGCGAIVDSRINKHHKDIATDIDIFGKKETVKRNDKAQITRNENVYYQSNTGLKVGALLGLVANPILHAVRIRGFSAIWGTIAAVTGVIGGMALGAITDHFSNNAAKKHADMQEIRRNIISS